MRAVLRSAIGLTLCLAAMPLPAATHDAGHGARANADAHGAKAHAAPKSETAFDEKAALTTSQAAIGRHLSGYRFTDSEGGAVTLEQFRGKPLVVSLIYTSCSHVCPIITRTVGKTVASARAVLGQDSFHVVTIGFDTVADTPERMRRYARERGGDRVHDWRFLSTDAATMERLAVDLGFIYFPSPTGFDHLAQTTVVDAEGKVYRQVYGENFAQPAMVEPLKDLIYGRKAHPGSLEGWLAGIKLFCTVYDASADRYRFDYSLFIGIAVGLMSLGLLTFVLVREWRRSGRARGRSAPGPMG